MGRARTAIVIATVCGFIGPPAMAQCYAPCGLFISYVPDLAFSGLNVARTAPAQIRVCRRLHRDFPRRRDDPCHGGLLRPTGISRAPGRDSGGGGRRLCRALFLVLAGSDEGCAASRSLSEDEEAIRKRNPDF